MLKFRFKGYHPNLDLFTTIIEPMNVQFKTRIYFDKRHWIFEGKDLTAFHNELKKVCKKHKVDLVVEAYSWK